jgi:hypothetical protein
MEVSSSGLEMVEVEELLQEEDFALFEDAVAHAKAFFEAQGGISPILLISGREVGASAPERTHKATPLPPDIRAVEHTWYIFLSGDKEHSPRAIFSLMEVMYHFQNQEWQFSVKVLGESDDPSVFMNH